MASHAWTMTSIACAGRRGPCCCSTALRSSPSSSSNPMGVERRVETTDVVDLADVLGVQCPSRSGFTLEPSQSLRIARGLGKKKLDGDVAIELVPARRRTRRPCRPDRAADRGRTSPTTSPTDSACSSSTPPAPTSAVFTTFSPLNQSPLLSAFDQRYGPTCGAGPRTARRSRCAAVATSSRA